MMGKIVFYGAISLDGYLATKEDSLQWLFDTPTGEKTTYHLYPEKKNFVFSTNKELVLNDATVVHEDPVSFVKNIKEHSNQTVWVVGGGNLLKPLIENHLIDEWWIQIAPVLLGEGIRLFQEGAYEERLKLVDTNYFGEFIELHYVSNRG